MVVIDIASNQKKAKKRFILHISLISLITALGITGSVLLLIYSKLEYTLNLILDIVICSLVAILLIFYFFNIFPLDIHYYRLYKNASSASLEHLRRMTFIKEVEPKDIDKVTHRVLQFSYREGEKEYIHNLYVLDNDVSFNEGTSYKLDTYHNVIVAFEVL